MKLVANTKAKIQTLLKFKEVMDKQNDRISIFTYLFSNKNCETSQICVSVSENNVGF